MGAVVVCEKNVSFILAQCFIGENIQVNCRSNYKIYFNHKSGYSKSFQIKVK